MPLMWPVVKKDPMTDQVNVAVAEHAIEMESVCVIIEESTFNLDTMDA